MKIRKRVLQAILTLILTAGIVCAGLFIRELNRVKQNSIYCGDKLRQELSEFLEHVSMPNATKSGGAYIYTGNVSYEGIDYGFTCKVYSKENIDLKLEHIKRTDMNESKNAQIYTIIGPEKGFDDELQAGKLVLRGEYEDHADVIFIDQKLWQNYVDPHKMIYGDSVFFKGNLSGIDGAAGTHYYNAVSIDILEELFVVNYSESKNL